MNYPSSGNRSSGALSVRILRCLWRTSIVLTLMFGTIGNSWADETAQMLNEQGEDPLGRDTPQGSMIGFLNAIAKDDMDNAARYLDLRYLPNEFANYRTEQLVGAFNLVLERGLDLDVSELSRSPQGYLDDGLPSYRDPLANFKTDQSDMLWMQKVPSDITDNAFVWKVSNRSIARLPHLYNEYRYIVPVEYLRKHLPKTGFLGLALFKWVWCLALMLATFLVVNVMARILVHPRLIDGVYYAQPLKAFLTGPLALIISVVIGGLALRSLGFGLEAAKFFETYTLTTIVVAWFISSGINLLQAIYVARLEMNGKKESIAIVSPLGTTIKVALLSVLFISWLDNLGYDIGALLAGLGVGGVAVALVLQKPLEDVFGAFTIFTQQPFKVGDFARFGSVVGTIEEIRLRTTRVRTLQNTQVSIPNAKLAAEVIENISARQQILYQPAFFLELDARAEQLRSILSGISALFDSHESVIKPGCRIRMTGFTEAGLRFEGFANIATVDYAEYLAICETLNLAIMEIVEQEGVRFGHWLNTDRSGD